MDQTYFLSETERSSSWHRTCGLQSQEQEVLIQAAGLPTTPKTFQVPPCFVGYGTIVIVKTWLINFSEILFCHLKNGLIYYLSHKLEDYIRNCIYRLWVCDIKCVLDKYLLLILLTPKQMKSIFSPSFVSFFASHILQLCFMVFTHLGLLCRFGGLFLYHYVMIVSVPGNFLCFEVYFIWYYYCSLCSVLIDVCMIIAFSLLLHSAFLYGYIWMPTSEFLVDCI